VVPDLAFAATSAMMPLTWWWLVPPAVAVACLTPPVRRLGARGWCGAGWLLRLYSRRWHCHPWRCFAGMATVVACLAGWTMVSEGRWWWAWAGVCWIRRQL
jgi:hypothetical protein